MDLMRQEDLKVDYTMAELHHETFQQVDEQPFAEVAEEFSIDVMMMIGVVVVVVVVDILLVYDLLMMTKDLVPIEQKKKQSNKSKCHLKQSE